MFRAGSAVGDCLCWSGRGDAEAAVWGVSYRKQGCKARGRAQWRILSLEWVW